MINIHATGSMSLCAGGSASRIKRATRLALASAMVLLVTPPAQAQQFQVLYSFIGSADRPNGVIVDRSGNLYGTTPNGGDLGACLGYGCGTVFEFSTSGGTMIFDPLEGRAGGEFPYLAPSFPASPAKVPAVYASTPYGGIANSACNGGTCGVVFEMTTTGKERVIYQFTGGTDGSFPYSPILHDSAGNLYGAASLGGNLAGSCSPSGCGVVFRLSKTGQETVLYTFTGGADGSGPGVGLARDSAGNLYGTTISGGNTAACGGNGCGVVFKIDPSGNETVLYTFTGGTDGAFPGYLIFGSDGNLYGTTLMGGDLSFPGGAGVVFELDPSGTETVLFSFTGGTDGALPNGGIIRDAKGNLYSTTQEGGNPACGIGCGVVFKLDPSGAETVLHAFDITDGSIPLGAIAAYNGYIYGTTVSGSASGVIYKVGQ